MRKAIAGTAILVLALLALNADRPATYADGSITWRVRGSEYIYDSDGTTKLEIGDHVELWDVGNAILLDEAAIGYGFLGDGQFSKAGANLATGTYTINVVAYNKPKDEIGDPGTLTGCSTPQTVVITEPPTPMTVDFAGFETGAGSTAVDLTTFCADSALSDVWQWGILTLLSAAVVALIMYRQHLTVQP